MTSDHKILYLPHNPWAHIFQNFYEKDLSLHEKSYLEQKAFFLEKQIGYSDAISYWLRQIGRDATEILWDVEPLQRKWAQENGVAFPVKDWQEKLLIEQIRRLKPTIVYLQHFYTFDLPVLQRLKEICPSIQKILLHRGGSNTRPHMVGFFRAADHVLSCTPNVVRYCKEHGKAAHVLYHSFDERVLEHCNPDEKEKKEVSFVGSSGYGYGIDLFTRYCWLTDLLEKKLIEIWADEFVPYVPSTPYHRAKRYVRRWVQHSLHALPEKTQKKILLGQGRIKDLLKEIRDQSSMKQLAKGKYPVPLIPLFQRFPTRVYPGKFGIELYQTLHQSKVTLNCHTFAKEGYVANMRLFHATGVGSCLLTDDGQNMEELFQKDTEVVTYSSTEECMEKIQYLQTHEKERKKIAKAGQKRTLQCHTTRQRMQELCDLFSL